MGQKKRKLEQNPPGDVAVVEPQGKKAKREGKKEKKEEKRKERDVAETMSVAQEAVEEKSKKSKKERKEKKEKRGKEDKKEKKEKKEKKLKTTNEDVEEESTKATNGTEPEREANQEPVAMDNDGDAAVTERSEKEKKKDKKDKEQANPESDQQQETEAPAKQKAARFIVFVGNLPYSANAESLKEHFEKIQPISVRVATQPDKPTKCRGFGFVEFDNYDRMKTCLKLYHHSSFDDGRYPPRRINVELTAGGGGKSEHRKAKIEYKNQKLAEERKRQATDSKKEKQQKPEGDDAGADPFAGIHPSRRMRMA